MKNKKQIVWAALAVLAVALLITLIIRGSTGKKPEGEITASTAAESAVRVSDVTVEDTTQNETVTVSVIEPVDTTEETAAVSVIEPVDTTEETATAEPLTLEDEPLPPRPTPTPGEEADPVDDPVTEHTPSDDGHGETNPVPVPNEPYNCGTPGHHCDSPETHAYILNLEAQGCPYCGRHDCPSFHATDEWGTAVYDPTKCPSYDVHNDPVYYCQYCHKPCGDGTNGSCVRFVNACYCPICGKWVEAWTCHSCEE